MNDNSNKMEPEMTHVVVTKGIVGIVAPLCGLGISVMSNLELALRCASLAAATAVSIAMFISILRKKP